MADLRVRRIDESDLDSVLAEDFEFEGEIHFEKPLLVKGHVSGQISSRSDLFISEGAIVDASVLAHRVSVKGTVRGDVSAEDRLELFASSRLEGNIATPDLIVQSGCTLNGNCSMPGGSSPKTKASAWEPGMSESPAAEEEEGS
ncbi:MAG: polymer-forming cytoskeletal protein [Spirochaetaceae bacterium]